MFSQLLGIMAMAIYNQLFSAGTIKTIMDRYSDIADNAMKLTAFKSMSLTIQGLAIGITTLLYFIDLSSKVTEKEFSTKQFFQATLRYATSYIFIINSSTIVGYLMDLGTAAADGIIETALGDTFFNAAAKTMLINGISKMKITEVLGYIVTSLLPWLLSMISEIMLQIIMISRILEIVVMTTLAPLAISDIYKEGTSSQGVYYMKKMFALGLQVAVILLINAAAQAIITELSGTTGATISNLLVASEYSGSEIDALKDGTLVFTPESIGMFLDALTGRNNSLKVLGIMLARVGLIWSSMPLCEEVTGAK